MESTASCSSGVKRLAQTNSTSTSSASGSPPASPMKYGRLFEPAQALDASDAAASDASDGTHLAGPPALDTCTPIQLPKRSSSSDSLNRQGYAMETPCGKRQRLSPPLVCPGAPRKATRPSGLRMSALASSSSSSAGATSGLKRLLRPLKFDDL